MLTSMKVSEFFDEVASKSPAPGGGSVSAFAATLGVALTSMVCRLTIGKNKYVDVQSEIESVLLKSEELRDKFASLIDEDTVAFQEIMTAYTLPKVSEDDKSARRLAIQSATKTATRVPLRVLSLCREAIELAQVIVEKGNKNSLSDTGVAILMIRAASEGAALNVRTNLGLIQDKEFILNVENEMTYSSEVVRKTSEDLLNQICSVT